MDDYNSNCSWFVGNEANTKLKLIEPILEECLCYNIRKECYKEFACPAGHNGKIDYVVKVDGKIVLAIEAKEVNADLDKCKAQVDGYSRSPELDEAQVLILTNGIEWRFFIRSENNKHFDFNNTYSKFLLNDENTYDTIFNFSRGFNIDDLLTKKQIGKFKKICKHYFHSLFDNEIEKYDNLREIFSSINKKENSNFFEGNITENVVKARQKYWLEAFEEFLNDKKNKVKQQKEKERKQKELEKQTQEQKQQLEKVDIKDE